MHPFNDLLQKFIHDELTEEELKTFLELVQEPVNQEAVKEAIGGMLEASSYTDLTAGMDIDMQFMQVLKKARAAADLRPVRRIRLVKRWLAAASVLILLAAGTFFWLDHHREKAPVAAQDTVDIAPGKEGAILLLADGTRVVLDSLGNGIIATQNGVQVSLKNGQLAYDAIGNATGETSYNTMTTPKGRQFQLLLPDGTKVWLNAASSIQYPTVFAGKERRVAITGEAYFEVAKNAKMPFHVNVSDQAEVEVLGTNFNINAYKDEEDIKTTLLEGSVRMTADGSSSSTVILKPGQQAQLPVSSSATRSSRIQVQTADLDKVMAWKNGFFNFEGASLREVMKQLERWYDITVVYEKTVPEIEFFGEINRNFSLADLINALKDVGVHFRIEEGRRLVVLP